MSFFIDMRGEPTTGSRIGEAIGQGIGQGFQTGMQLKLSDMLQRQATEREEANNARINKQLYGIDSGANPQAVGNFYKLMIEHGGLERANQARSIAAGVPTEGMISTPIMQEKLPKKINPQEPIPEPKQVEPEIPGYEQGSAKDLENRRAKVIEAYNEERDPKVKKEIYSTVKDLNKQILDQKKEEREARNEAREVRAEQNTMLKPYIDRAKELRQQNQKDRESLLLARKAINMGDTNSWSQFFAQRYGADPLKSSATQLLSLASKEFTIGSLKNISAKAQNQWIEQRFTSMFPSVGSKKDAQETNLAVLERTAAIKEKELDLYENYTDKFRNNPEKIDKYVAKDLRKFEADTEDQLSYELSKIKDRYSTPEQLYSVDKPINGEYITPEKFAAFTKKYNGDKLKAQNELVKLGYRMPSKKQYEAWRRGSFLNAQGDVTNE